MLDLLNRIVKHDEKTRALRRSDGAYLFVDSRTFNERKGAFMNIVGARL